MMLIIHKADFVVIQCSENLRVFSLVYNSHHKVPCQIKDLSGKILRLFSVNLKCSTFSL